MDLPAHPRRPDARRRAWVIAGALGPVLSTVLLLLGLVWSRDASPTDKSYAPGTARQGRVVFVIIDSLAARLAQDPQRFPTLVQLAERGGSGQLAGCLPASTVTCTRTMLEGSTAGYIESVHNFAARRAPPTAFPALARAQGLRVGMASDYTLNEMFEHLDGPYFHYAEQQVPRYAWDEAGTDRVLQWLQQDRVDVALLHLVDLDKVSHAAGPGTDAYAAEIAGADASVARLWAALGPMDTLIIAGDHGHNQSGNHTPDPGYVAVGPQFVPAREDFAQETMALLLSVAAGTPLPGAYEGAIPAEILAQPFGGSGPVSDILRAEIDRGRAQRREDRRQLALWSLPCLLIGLWSVAAYGVNTWARPDSARKTFAVATALTAVFGFNLAIGYGWFDWARPHVWVGPPSNFGIYLAVGGVCVWVLMRVLGTGLPSRREALALAAVVWVSAVRLPGDDYFGLVTMAPRLWAGLLVLLVLGARWGRAYYGVAWTAALVTVAAWNALSLPSFVEHWSLRVLLAAVIAWALARWGRLPRREAWILMAAMVALAGPFGHGTGGVLVLGALAGTALALPRGGGNAERAASALLLLGILVAFATALQTFRFEAVRFEFGFSWFPFTKDEATLAALISPLIMIKYSLPVVVIALCFREVPHTRAALVVLWLSVLVLLGGGFVAGLMLDGSSRLHEVVLQELIMLGLYTIGTAGALIAVAGAKAASPATANHT